MPLSPAEDVLTFYERTVAGFTKKADHKKNEAIRCFVATVAATLLAPLFISFGDAFSRAFGLDTVWLGKVAPSVLSLCATASTAWLQLRRPQQLWGLYRTAQRELEDQKTKYQFGIGEYKAAEAPDRLFAEKIAAIALGAHRDWLPMVPNPDTLAPRDSTTKALRRDQTLGLSRGGGE